jgi:hypothetical protein
MKLFSSRRLPLAAMLAAPFAFTAQQAAAQVDVDVNITLNGLVILNYYSQIDVTIPSAVLGGLFSCAGGGSISAPGGVACNQGSAGAVTATGTATQLTAAPTDVPTPGPGTTPSAVPLVLEDVWAVRAIANSGQTVGVTVTAGVEALTNGAASIAIAGATVAPASFAPPGLVNPTYGDVTLTLNLANATLAGAYSSLSGDDYTLDVTLL